MVWVWVRVRVKVRVKGERVKIRISVDRCLEPRCDAIGVAGAAANGHPSTRHDAGATHSAPPRSAEGGRHQQPKDAAAPPQSAEGGRHQQPNQGSAASQTIAVRPFDVEALTDCWDRNHPHVGLCRRLLGDVRGKVTK